MLGELPEFVILMTFAMGTENPRSDVMEFLLKVRGDRDEDTGGCLVMAAMTGNVKAMEWLIERYGRNLVHTTSGNDRGRTPMFVAAANGHVEAMKLLEKNGANVDAPDNDGQSPIFLAVGAGKTESIDCLVGLRANVNFKDRKGSTPLHYAVLANSVELVDCLMKNRAEIDDRSPMTPMVFAIAQGQVDILDCMVKNHAKVRPIDIFAAAGEGQIKVLEYLKKHLGTRWTDVVNSEVGGMTPVMVAEGQGRGEAAAWLRKNDAR
jgi:ankyrin repeat protein